MPPCQLQKRRTCHEAVCRALLTLAEREPNHRLVRMWRFVPWRMMRSMWKGM